MNEKKLKRLCVAVTGASSAVSVPHFLWNVRESLSEEVRVVATPRSARFVTTEALEAFSGGKIQREIWEGEGQSPHIAMARWAEVVVVIPCTANTLAGLAAGTCDNPVTLTVLSTESPVVVCPTMNQSMWRSKAVQRNVKIISEEFGYHVVMPVKGPSLSAGDDGKEGALASFEVIADRIRGVAE